MDCKANKIAKRYSAVKYSVSVVFVLLFNPYR